MFPPFEGCSCLLSTIPIVLHLILTQYSESSIVYIFNFTVKIPLCQRKTHLKANNDVYSIRWHQLCVLFSLRGVLGAMLDDCTCGRTWKLLSFLWDAWGLSGTSGVQYKSNTQCRKHSSPQVLILVSRLLIHEVPGGCARWRLGHVVFVNQHNAQYQSKLLYLTSWTRKLQELMYMYPFLPPTPPISFTIVLHIPPAFWINSTSHYLHKSTPHFRKHTRQLIQYCKSPPGFLRLHATEL